MERLGESRLAVHQPQAAGGTRRAERTGRGQPLAAEDRRHPGTARVLLPDAGRARRRPPERCLPTSTRSGIADYNELLAWAPRVLAKIQTLPGLVDVSTDREQGGLQVNVAIDRVAASRLGRARAGHRQRAQQRLRPAADLDALYPAQPVSRHSRDRSAISARPDRPHPHLCERRQQHPGPAHRRDQDHPRAFSAGGQPPGPVSRDHHQLRSRRKRHHRAGDAADRPGGRRAAHPRHAARRICRRRARLSPLDRRAAAADRGGARSPSTSCSACCTRAWRIR